jgi:hypothetical protein
MSDKINAITLRDSLQLLAKLFPNTNIDMLVSLKDYERIASPLLPSDAPVGKASVPCTVVYVETTKINIFPT